MNKRFIFIIVFCLIGLIALLTGVILFSKNNNQEFVKSGYVINSLASGNSEKIYFDEGSSYKVKYPESIKFKDIDETESTVSLEHFLHYLDGSIAFLKNGVLLDLSTLNSDLVAYYNITNKSNINYSEGSYYIEHASDSLDLTNFIGKISDNKYIVAGKDLSLKMSGSNDTKQADYYEITFIEGDIVLIENQEVSYQTISNETYLYIGKDITINLGNKTIYYQDDAKMTLSQMVIDDEDNIDIVPVEEKEKTDNNDNTNTNTTTNNTTNTEETNNNTTNKNTETNKEENVTNNSATTNNQSPSESEGGSAGNLSISKEPKFALSDADVTATGIFANITVLDEKNILTSDLNLTITNTTTGRVVYQRNYPKDTQLINLNVENLVPESNHVITITGNYTEDGVSYDKQFFNKILKTDTLGIDFNKDYATSDSLSYLVSKLANSNVTGAQVQLYDQSGNLVETKTIDLTIDGDASVTFDNLTSNTSYKAILNNILYNGTSLVNQIAYNETNSTLKTKPAFGETGFTINKKAYSFTMRLDDLDDPDNGIVNYHYLVYKNSDLDNPIMTIDKKTGATADLAVDGTKIVRSEEYVFKAVVEFDDNEKTVEYESEISDVMSMDSVTFPTISFESSEVTFEHINGNLIINDEYNALDIYHNLRVTYTDSVGTVKTLENVTVNEENNSILLNIEGLRANETYILSLYGDIDLQDENDILTNHLVGSVVVKTDKIIPLTVLSWEEAEGYNMLVPFTVSTRLGSTRSSTLEASTLGEITYNLYAGTTINGALVSTVTKENMNISSYHDSSLKTAYYDKSYDVTPSFFGLTTEELKELSGNVLYKNYTIEITEAYDYSGLNNIPIENNIYTITTSEELPDYDDDDETTEIVVTEIKNNGIKDDLKSGTIIGYKVKPVYNISANYGVTANYYVYDVTDGTENLVLERNIPVDDYTTYDGEIFDVGYGTDLDVNDTTLVRGHIYKFAFNLTVDDGANHVTWPNDSTKITSDNYTAFKQEPTVLLYPYESSDSSITYMYKITDPDHGLSNPLTAGLDYSYKLYHAVLGASRTAQAVTASTEFKPITFGEMTAGNPYYIRYKQTLLKSSTQPNYYNKIVNIDTSKFEGLFNTSNLTLTYALDNSTQANTILVTIPDYYDNIGFYNRVAAYKLVFTAGEDKIVMDNQLITNLGNGSYGFLVDYSDLVSMKGKTINVDVYTYYDTGLIGYNVTSDYGYAFQTNGGYQAYGLYIQLSSSNALATSETALGSKFDYTLNENTNRLEITNTVTTGTKSLKYNYSKAGIMSDDLYYSPKKLERIKLSGSNTTFSFSKLVPGVSFDTITPSLRGVDLKMNVYGLDKNILSEENYFILIYDEDNNLVKTVTVALEDIEDIISIRELMPNTNYHFTVNVKMTDETGYVQLYDNNTEQYLNYDFTTTNTVQIDDASLTYNAESYDDKSLIIAYTLGVTEGYDEIRYSLYYKNDEDEKVYLTVDPDTTLESTMNNVIEINPGFVFGKTYYLDIIPVMYYEEAGVTKEYTDFVISHNSIEIDSLRDPNFVVRKNATLTEGNYGLTFKVVSLDEDKTIVNGTYYVELYDTNDLLVASDDCNGQGCPISLDEKAFAFNNLNPAEQYTFKVKTKIDKNYVGANNITDVTSYDYRMLTIGASGVSFGEMSIKDKDNSIYLIFTDSSGLSGSNITMYYSIYGTLNNQNQYFGSVNLDDEGALESILQQVNFGNRSFDYYYYKLMTPSILAADQYNIALQFRIGNTTIYEYNTSNYVID